MDLDDTLCYCFHISKRKVVNFVRQTKPRKASQISECFGAGSGCGWCIPALVRIHEDILGGRAPAEDPTSPADSEALRRKYIQDVAAGLVAKNRHERTGAEREPGDSAGGAPAAEDPLDYTRYFSRSRPDPEPDDLQ